MKRLLLFFIFFVGMLSYGQVLTEGFEGTSGPTGGTWTLGSGTWARFEVGTPGFQWSPTTANPNTGSRAAFMVKQNGVATEDWLVTPQVVVPANGQLRFYNRLAQNANQGNMFYIMVSTTSQTDPTSFTQIAVYNEFELMDEPAAGNGGSGAYNIYNQIILPLTAYVGDNVYIAFKSTQLGGGDSWYLDDVVVDQVCMAPTALASSAVTGTTATISWNDSNGATAFEIEYGPVGFTPGTGTVVAATSSPHILTDLSSITAYEYYVRTLCSATNSSEDAGPKTFNTGALPPVCGGNFVDNGGPTSNYLNSSNQTITICPDNPNETLVVTFTSFNTEATYDALYVYDGSTVNAANIISSGNGPGNVLGGQAGGFWGDLTNNLPGPFIASTPGGCLTFKFRSDSGSNRPGWLANITCESCVVVTDLTASDIQMDTATLSWTDNNTPAATAWEVVVQPLGTGLPTASSVIIPATTNPFTLPVGTLSPGVEYEYYVRSVCNAVTNDSSDWSLPFEFLTPLCEPINKCTYVFDTWDSVGNGWTGNTMSVLQSGIVVGTITGPLNTDGLTHVEFPIGLCDGEEFSLVWNNGGTFPVQVGIEILDSSGESVFFKPPGTGAQGSTIYTGMVSCAAPTCFSPQDLIVSSVNDEEAVITWTQPGTNVTSWNLVVQPAGTGIPNASSTIITVTTNPFTITGLDYNTQYEFYLSADCGSTDGLSYWRGPEFFQTLLPGCGTSTSAGDACATATPICTLDGYCSNTSSSYSDSSWSQLDSEFCGSIENNSFLSFVASGTSISFTVEMGSCEDNNGIQVFIFSAATCGSGPVTELVCYNSVGTVVNSFPVSASGLVPGNTYYIMFDGYAGDVCDFAITADSSAGLLTEVSITNDITNVTANEEQVTMCLGEVLSLTAQGGDNVYTWTTATSGLSGASGTTVTFTPSEVGTFIIEAESTNSTSVCSSTATVEVTVAPAPVITFDQIPDSCVGTTGLILPTTSIEGVTGSWSPSTIDTSVANTTEYTFTPDNGQCANNVLMTVVISNEITPVFSFETSLCLNSTAPALPSADDNNGTTGTWLPATIDTSALGTTVYTFTPDAGQCGVVTTVNVEIINAIDPTFNFITTYCENASNIPALPLTSDNNIVGTWSPASINASTQGTTTYTFTPAADQCAVPTTVDVEIVDSIDSQFSFETVYCLASTPDVLPGTSDNNITGVWSPAAISTASNGSSTYTFTPDPNQCAGVITVNVDVTSDIVALFDIETVYCINATPDLLPTTSNNSITGSWSPSVISTSTVGTTAYVFTADANQCSGTFTLNVTINDLDVITFKDESLNEIISFLSICGSETARQLPTAYVGNSPISGTWSPATINFSTVGTSTYTFTPSNSACSNPSTFDVTIEACGIPKGISPNGDGKNDFFDLSAYNVSKLEIFNRYGTKVYSKTNYTNEWGGATDKGEDLPDATYFYVIKLAAGEDITGWVYINREL